MLYTQAGIRKAMNHINSVPREELGGETPYRLALKNMAPKYSRPGGIYFFTRNLLLQFTKLK